LGVAANAPERRRQELAQQIEGGSEGLRPALGKASSGIDNPRSMAAAISGSWRFKSPRSIPRSD
jgi:hypothetical protein